MTITDRSCCVCAQGEEDRKPARKTCMKCEISMCVQHLQAHLTTPVLLQTHPLTEPMALCGTTKCPHHGKLLEYYCLDDMTCVCVSCAIEDQHRLHNMKTFSTAHKELMEKLDTDQQALKVKTDDENVSLEKWEESEKEKVVRSSVRLIEAVTNLRDIALTSVQSSVSARMVSIKTSKSSIQAAKGEKDTFRFLQMYSQVHVDVEKAKAVDMRQGLEPSSDRDKLVEEIIQNGEEIMEQADHFWGSLLTLVDPENHQEQVPTSLDLIFDPQTSDPGMSLSTDSRKIFYSSWLRKSSSNMFHIQNAESKESVPDRWVIRLSDGCDWTIGLCEKNYVKGSNNGDIYALCCQGNKVSTLITEYYEGATTGINELAKSKKSLSVCNQAINPQGENVDRPQDVEVVWSFPDSLSFFSMPGRHQRRKIVTITISSPNPYLIPFVSLKVEESQKSSNSSGVFGSSSFRQGGQKEWKCSCGRIYPEMRNAHTFGMSSQVTCSCGKIIGGFHITKELCELL
uniref:tripartite motif-containing protein 16 n=1 Tax=Scatophagus argus TaxID=75038 RepID=UPI001ED836EE|nr:tripartite motif-containing protein 16 [Scatophagus argus]